LPAGIVATIEYTRSKKPAMLFFTFYLIQLKT